MENDTWASGARVSRQTPRDRLEVLFRREAANYARELCNANLTKADKRGYWINPNDNEAYDLDAWTDTYLANDDPDPQGSGKTLGEVRAALHRARAEELYAEEQRKIGQKAEARKIVGTKI
jgi:hypothetical protein